MKIDDHLTAELAKSGRDEFGWSDFSFLRPEAPNPDKALTEAVSKIEGVLTDGEVPVSRSAEAPERIERPQEGPEGP